MTLDLFISALVTLLVTVDPLGLAPIFLGVTEGLDDATRRAIAWRAGGIAFLILVFFSILGASLLGALGIGLPAFRIGGGLLLFWIAFEMVFAKRPDRKSSTAEAMREDNATHIAAFPLAIPLIAGPGAITAVLLIAGRTDGSVLARLLLVGLVAVAIAGCILSFLMAGRIARRLGETGTAVLSRILGVVLTALAVQFVIDGIVAVLRG